LFLQMNERTRKLDKSLKEGVILVFSLQPEVFKDIMRFVVFLSVEADEVREIAGIESSASRPKDFT